MDRDILAALAEIDSVNPYATFLNDSTLSEVDEWIDTGNYALNAIISGSLYGGIPKGRIVQFAGPSMCGKSYFILQILANAQKQGMTVVIFDSENAINQKTAIAFGLDPSKVKYITSVTVEQTKNAIYKFLKGVKEKGLEGKFIIAIDSLANLQSEMDLTRMEKESVSADMGSKAKAVKSLLTTCTNMSTITKTPIIFSNHVFDNPAQMFPSIENNIACGKSCIYLPSVTVQLARKLVADDDGKTLDSKLAVAQKKYSGIVVRALTTKNRFMKQYLECEMYLSFSTGLNRYYGLLEIMKGMGVVENKGSIYYDWNGEKMGFAKSWRNDKDLWENKLLPELENRIKKEWSYGNLKDDEEIPEEEEDVVVKVVEEKSTNPLDELRKLKNKVSDKLDQIEETSSKDQGDNPD
jgi:RecA/RadA recombinase